MVSRVRVVRKKADTYMYCSVVRKVIWEVPG